jgi:class 3 adenylate cyclase
MATLKFDSKRPDGEDAIVVAFDLCGFSEFCDQVDSYPKIPQLISALFAELGKVLKGTWEDTFLIASQSDKRVPEPNFLKYTGDGALLIWFAESSEGFDEKFCTALVAAMRHFQDNFAILAPEWERNWRVHSLPKRIRFGIAKGTAYPLRSESAVFFKGETLDHVGYCINLAVRLQNHCPELGFLVHATLHPNLKSMVRLEAIGMKGISRAEPILVFEKDLTNSQMQDGYFRTKFRRS